MCNKIKKCQETQNRQVRDGAVGQIERAFQNVKVILESNDYNSNDLVKTTTFLTRREDISVMREVRERMFPSQNSSSDPAATLVFVAGLFDPEWVIEVEAIAAKV